MTEQETRSLAVSWITTRIERDLNASEIERVFFEASDTQRYYISLEKQNRSAELVAASLITGRFPPSKAAKYLVGRARWPPMAQGGQSLRVRVRYYGRLWLDSWDVLAPRL